jgi:ubiquitin-protein ligase
MLYQSLMYIFFPDWVPIHTLAYIITIITVILTFYVPESPKYMYAHRRYDEVRQILKEIARKNGLKIPNE